MSHPLVRSWQFNWAAEGRAPRTMREMTRFLSRFEAALAEEGGDLLSASRFDCESFLASYASPLMANYAWRSLRSFFKFAAEELERPSPMVRVKAPKMPLTEVSTATDEDVAKLLKTCAP